MLDKWLNQAADLIFVLRDRLHHVRKNVAADSETRVRAFKLPSLKDVKKNLHAVVANPELRKPRTLMGIAAGIVIVGCMYILFREVGPARPSTVYYWYYDLNTNKLIIAPDQIPPIPTPSGLNEGVNAGVRAYLFSCGECSDKLQRFIGYLETFPPEAQASLNNAVGYGGIGDNPDRGRNLVKRPTDEKWVEAASDDGVKVMSVRAEACPNGYPPKACDDPYAR